VLFSEGNGSYLEKFVFDDDEGRPFWHVNEQDMLTKWIKPEDVLPSDTSRREDSINIIAKNWDLAEEEKHRLEELQRADKKLRIAAQEAREGKAQTV